jgi:hypothetical protein
LRWLTSSSGARAASFRFVILSDEVAAATEESKDLYRYHESRFS